MSVRPESSQIKRRNMDYDLGLHRLVSGEKIDEIYGNLSRLAMGADGIDLPINPQKQVSPRLQLIKPKEIVENRFALNPLKLVREELMPVFLERVPSLSEPIPLVINGVGYDRVSNGAHFMQLRFGRGGRHQVAEERRAIWNVLSEEAAIHRDEIVWDDVAPDIRVAFFNPDIPWTVVNSIKRYINKQLEFDATLEPLTLSAQQDRLAA